MGSTCISSNKDNRCHRHPLLDLAAVMLFWSLAAVPYSAEAATVKYLSDMTWISAVSGGGPIEKDRSRGGQLSGDGNTLKIGGKTYTKGLGVHAYSDIRYKVNRSCQSFASDVGVDDEVGNLGSVIFQVWGDGRKLYQSGTLYGYSPPLTINVDTTAVDELQLVVQAVENGAYDHADWAGARLSCNGPLVASAPIVIDGKQNTVVRGVRISNANGPCIVIRHNAKNVRVENSELGPCAGGGIIAYDSAGVVIDNVYIHHTGTTGNGIDVSYSDDVTVTNSRLEFVRTGIYVLESSRIRIERNRFLNMLGPMPRGQFVQFDKVRGPGNRIKCNVGENIPGASNPEDSINIYQSSGEPNDWLRVTGNKIKGGGPSISGGGILLGDHGGAYIFASDNILVNPGQHGITVASGHHIMVMNNLIFGKAQSFTNVGLSVWNQSWPQCFAITAQGNSINFVKTARVIRTRSGRPEIAVQLPGGSTI